MPILNTDELPAIVQGSECLAATLATAAMPPEITPRGLRDPM